MNTFRMGLLKERAEKIRPDLTKARQILERAADEKREPTDEEKAFTRSSSRPERSPTAWRRSATTTR